MVDLINMADLLQLGLQAELDAFVESADLPLLLHSSDRTAQLGRVVDLILGLLLDVQVLGDIYKLNLEEFLDGLVELRVGPR